MLLVPQQKINKALTTLYALQRVSALDVNMFEN